MPPGRQAGFSLIELMVTVGVLAILVTLAVPSLIDFVNASRLTAAANETIAAFQGARMEAIKANRRVVACLSANPDAGAPSCSAVSPTGWIVFADANRDGQFTAGERLLRTVTVAAGIQMQGSASLAGRVIFRSDGMARTAAGDLLTATVDMCMPTRQPKQNVRHVSIGSGSRMSIQRADAGGECRVPNDRPQ